jgi:hypothetical protein
MHKLVCALGIAVLALIALSVGLMGDRPRGDPLQGDSDARAATAPLMVTGTFTGYLPAVMNRYSSTVPTVARIVTVPVTIRSVHAAGQDHAAAYDPAGSGVFLDSPALAASLHTWDYGQYRIDRAYLVADVPDHGEVVTAALSLVPCASWYTDQDPLPPPTMTLHLGTWQDLLADRQALWGAWDSGVVLGEFDTTDIFGLDCHAGETQRTLIPLDPAHIHPGQALKLALRDGEDHVDLRPAYGHKNRVFGAHDLGGQVWLEIGFAEGDG